MTETLVVFVVLAILVIFIIAKTAVVVPQQSAYIVERLGKYRGTLQAGFHILTPFADAVRYRHSLKESAVDIPEQVCITRDNVQVHVDGVLYLKVLNPERASYGVMDYLFAISQLAQTALRSEVGKIDLDRTFEERTHINNMVVSELDKASAAKKQQQINEAEGAASAILAIASATAEGTRRVAEAINLPGGFEAVQLRVADHYIEKFGQLANASDTTLIVPASVGDISGMLATAMNVISRQNRGNGGEGGARPPGSPPP